MMGAFVLFLFLIYINENIAIIPKEQTFLLNDKPKVSPADPYNLPIRRYKEEYYDPFLQDIYSDTQYRKEFFDAPSYRCYKDDDILKSERFYFKLPPQSRKYIENRTVKRNPEISPENHSFQSDLNYIDFSTQDQYPSKEMENAEKSNWSNRESFLRSRTKEYTSDYYERLDNPKSNENRMSKPEYDAHLKLHDNYFMQIPLKSEHSLDNAYISHISPIVECRGANKNYSDISEKNPLDNRHINQKPGTNLAGNYRTPNEADEFIDHTHLKHSLTSSASAVENRLLTSHITKTFEKVKGDEENMPDGPLNDIPFWKSPSNKKYMNSLENKLRNLYAENHTKDEQNIKTTLASSRLPQQIASQQIYKTKPFESRKTYNSSSLSTTPGVTGISLSDKSRNRLNEIRSPSVNQTCTETQHENSFSNRTMEEINPAKFLKHQIQTTANQIIPSHYDMAKNSKLIGATKETLHYDNLYRSATFDVNSKLINDCIEPIDVNNHNGSNKQTKHDMLNLKSSVPLNGFDISNYTSECIKAFYYPSNIKPSLLYNENKNNVNCNCIRTNAEGVFIQPNLAIDKSFVKSDIKNIVPESIKSSINQVPRCYLGRNNLTSSQDGNTMNQDISGEVYKIPEVHPSIGEPYIIHPNSISKNSMENRSNSIKCYALPSLSSPINHNNEDKRRMYSSPMYVQPTPIKVYPQPTTVNVKSTHNTPVVSAAPYTAQAPKNSFYEINKPKVTFLNPTKAQNPEGYKNPTVTTNEPKVLQQNYSKLNPIKSKSSNVHVSANTGYQVHSPINKYNSLLSASLNNITSVIVSNILSSFNKDISKTLKKPLAQGSNVTPISCEIPTFEVTHPCIESPRYLPETPIKIRKDNSTRTATNKSSKPCVSTTTINVLPPVQQISNDIIILV